MPNVWKPSKEEIEKRREILRYFRDRKWFIFDNLIKYPKESSTFKWEYHLHSKEFHHIGIIIWYSFNIYHVEIHTTHIRLLNTTFTYIQKVDLTQCIYECCFDKLI